MATTKVITENFLGTDILPIEGVSTYAAIHNGLRMLFVPPTNPGPTAIDQSFSTVPVILHLIFTYKELLQVYKECLLIDNSLKE